MSSYFLYLNPLELWEKTGSEVESPGVHFLREWACILIQKSVKNSLENHQSESVIVRFMCEQTTLVISVEDPVMVK